LPEWADVRELDPAVRTALRGLESRNAETVGRHLVAAGGLLQEDPELALEHARAARDRASRIAAVREAVGVAAYHASDFAEAARELRAYRRMSGDESYRAVLADCERALGRPDNALRLVHEALEANPEPDELIELRLVEAGARHDLDELPAALLVLEAALGGRPTPAELGRADLGQLRLATAYADLLEEQGEGELAAEWFGAIAAADPDDLTGVSTRFGDDEDEDDEEDGADEATGHEPGGDDGHAADTAAQAEVEVETATVLADDEDEAELGDEVELDDVEAEVAELLGEAPPNRAALEFDHSRLFQEAPGQTADDEQTSDEQDPPTN
jgi:tetratricopeptide (TPR) repeat protein